ncbi:MAG: ABC transporter substrate-binding protein, partial [Chloroflexota bacterium]|nr:ABC transporter substrate-binding protein [Chloroflexota bacterium]
MAAPPASAPTTAATTGAQHRGGTLNIGQDFGPQSLDPTRYSAWASTNVAELIYTGLLRWNKDMQLEPDLAQTWEIAPDGRTYTFHLRQNVKFHNGKSFRAEDVKYTIDRIKNPATAS